MDPTFLKYADAAQLARVSSKTLYRAIRSGALPAVRLGRSVRIRRAALEAFLLDAEGRR